MNTSNQRSIGTLLQNNRIAKIIEIPLLFVIGYIVLTLLEPLAGGDPVLEQTAKWFTNVAMLLVVWLGMKLRGEQLKDFGLNLSFVSWKRVGIVFLQSLVVLVITIVAFVLASIIMANITGIPEGANMSGYDYMRDNIGLFLLTLTGVLIVSSFGEEIIYRAFLINRLTELGLNGKKVQTVAVILSAIIFGFAHYSWGPMGIAQTTFMGLALGFSYIYLKKRIIVLVIAHAYMDITLMIQVYLASQ